MNFAKKCIKCEKIKCMFPLQEKLHKMDQKYSEKFIVNYANTERYFKSLIPYMQRLLNNDELENMDKQNDQKRCKRMPG